MQEIRLWTIEKSEQYKFLPVPLEPLPQIEAENQLEELIVSSPEILLPHLKLVGRQNPTESGFLDLLGIDEDGKLVVFELKRGTLTREVVAQIVDYASSLASMTPESLAEYISERSGIGGIEKIEDFDNWYQQIFPNSPSGYAESPRMVLVGLGADERTYRMTSYLAESGVNISLLTFYAFKSDGKVVLARHVNVEAAQTEEGKPTGNTRTSMLQALNTLAEHCEVKPLLDSIALFLRSELPAYDWPSKSGYAFGLMERTERGTPSYRVYVSVYVNERKPKQLQLIFWKRAVEAAPLAFDEMKKESPIKFVSKSGNLETWVKSSSEWETLSGLLKPVLDSMVDGWKRKSQEE